MKKIFTTLFLSVALTASALAVTVADVAGTFRGNLNIDGQDYPNKEVYVLPGIEASTITFVLPDFMYQAASLGNIVLTNIPVANNGQLTLEDATLYLPALSQRAKITVVNGLEEGGQVYNSVLSSGSAMILLSIEAPSLNDAIFVLFTGDKVTSENFAITNGGFEGTWVNNEVPGWHSFPSAMGTYSSFVTGNTEQFQSSSNVRPGSTGSKSVHLRTNLTAGAKANGNCTNGRINAGSMTATDASGNYNFSDPSSTGYNTPFVGNPDSIVFWAKYEPADQNPSNSENRARTHAVITTNARYQDPEVSDYSDIKVADAAINYAATSNMGWQRLAAPFNYTAVNPNSAAYILVTFTTNKTPGGGTTYSTGAISKTYYYDHLYLDDAEIVYNHDLSTFQMDGKRVAFNGNSAKTNVVYNDSTINFVAATNGKASKSFIGFDAAKRQVHVYVVPDNYSQKQDYSVYTLTMAEPVELGAERYVTICEGESYTDNAFEDLSEPGEYVGEDPETGDLVILVLSIAEPYYAETSMTINEGENKTWEGYDLSTYAQSEEPYVLVADYATEAGCDSTLVLNLTVNERITTALPTTKNERVAQKVFYNGNIYIIRGDETIYDILGRRVK